MLSLYPGLLSEHGAILELFIWTKPASFGTPVFYCVLAFSYSRQSLLSQYVLTCGCRLFSNLQ